MRPMPELKVVEVPVGDLLEYENNAKIHTHDQIDQIANSIGEFGFSNPVLAWHNADGDAEIVSGHGSVRAAIKEGLDKVPVVFVDHLSDEQPRAFTHVINQTTLSSGFDYSILDAEMDALDFDWEDFGFDKQSEIDIDSFFSEEPAEKGHAPKMMTCPHCGEEFEL